MGRKIILSIVLCGCALILNAQEFEIVEFNEKPHDQSAQFHHRKDGNGTNCGLIRVLLKESGAKFEGSYVVGEPEIFTGGYNVYLAAGGKKFTIKHDNFFPIEVSVSSYGVKSIESDKTYEMTVVTKESSLGNASLSVFAIKGYLSTSMVI